MAGRPLLVDTCVIMYVLWNERLAMDDKLALSASAHERRLFVSPASAWELGLGMARGRIKSTLSAIEFFNRFLEVSGGQVCDLSPEMLAGSCALPSFNHRDPADCMLVATARVLGLVLVTSDRKILEYGNKGYVNVMAV
jgi:PIN domain nuclease of toxin-antitoxin system